MRRRESTQILWMKRTMTTCAQSAFRKERKMKAQGQRDVFTLSAFNAFQIGRRNQTNVPSA